MLPICSFWSIPHLSKAAASISSFRPKTPASSLSRLFLTPHIQSLAHPAGSPSSIHPSSQVFSPHTLVQVTISSCSYDYSCLLSDLPNSNPAPYSLFSTWWPVVNLLKYRLDHVIPLLPVSLRAQTKIFQSPKCC